MGPFLFGLKLAVYHILPLSPEIGTDMGMGKIKNGKSQSTRFAWFNQKISLHLRKMPTFVTAHMFCVSRGARVSYGWCLLIQEYFCAV